MPKKHISINIFTTIWREGAKIFHKWHHPISNHSDYLQGVSKTGTCQKGKKWSEKNPIVSTNLVLFCEEKSVNYLKLIQI